MISSIREKHAEVEEVDSAILIEKDSAPAPKGQIFLDWLFFWNLPEKNMIFGIF